MKLKIVGSDFDPNIGWEAAQLIQEWLMELGIDLEVLYESE